MCFCFYSIFFGRKKSRWSNDDKILILIKVNGFYVVVSHKKIVNSNIHIRNKAKIKGK